jgi:hypothetical protein
MKRINTESLKKAQHGKIENVAGVMCFYVKRILITNYFRYITANFQLVIDIFIQNMSKITDQSFI